MAESRGRLSVKVIGVLLAALLFFIVGRVLLDRAAEGRLLLGRIDRHEIAPGIEVVHADLFRSFSEAGRLIAVYADPTKIRLSILLNERQLPINALAQDALMVVNGSYFTPQRKPTGLLVSDGHALSPLVKTGGGAGTGVLVIRDGRVMLFEREQIERTDYDGSSFAIQAGPRVIEPGGSEGIRSDDGLRANRTVIGADAKGRVVVAVTYDEDGNRTGPSLFELMQLLGKKGLGELAPELALDFALNLDGGPSTGLFLRDVKEEIDLPEGARVYSVLSLRIIP